jgi:ElaB/YqjD/DUF883 family membrane-anchored ribosome-binding protein
VRPNLFGDIVMSNPQFRSVNKAADDAEEGVEERLNRLRADADAIIEEGEDLPDDIRGSLEAIEERIAEIYDVVSEQAAYSAEVVEEIIETRPWMSVAVAFGAGCLATLLLTPRPRKRSWYEW